MVYIFIIEYTLQVKSFSSFYWLTITCTNVSGKLTSTQGKKKKTSVGDQNLKISCTFHRKLSFLLRFSNSITYLIIWLVRKLTDRENASSRGCLMETCRPTCRLDGEG